MMSLNSSVRLQPALRAEGVLERLPGWHRRAAEAPGGDLDVLRFRALTMSAAVRFSRRYLVGVEPDPHAVVELAEHRHVPDALDLLELVHDFDRGVVAQVQRGREIVRGSQVHHQQDVRRLFLTLTPVCLTSCGKVGKARLTRFCTWTCASSRFVPTSKVTVRTYVPSLVHCDDM